MAYLPRKFYQRATLLVAQDVLGKVLVHDSREGRTGGRIVEAEVYIGESDPACHAHAGRTPRNETMYGPAGFAYVYFTYGMHYMFNIVTEAEGYPAAVLVRALDPLEGIDLMRQRRGVERLSDLCSGPAKLCVAMGIDTSLLGSDLCAAPLYLKPGRQRRKRSGGAPVTWSPRIGIRNGLDKHWRCYETGNPHVSRSRPGPPSAHRRKRS